MEIQQVAAGDGAALGAPELGILRAPVVQHRARQRADRLRLLDLGLVHLGLVDVEHLRQLGQLFGCHACRLALHLPDGEVHPHQRRERDREQQHEAALPHAGEVVGETEQDRQHEAAQAPDQADDAAHRAHVVRVVDRDVLVDRGLAEAHEEPEDEHQHGEGDKPGLQPERHRPADALHDVLGRRIGQDERDGDRHAEGPVHDAARAIGVGQVPAVDAEQARGHRVGGADHAGGGDVEAVDADQIARQPQRQRHEGAEHEEVVEREAPDLDVLQRLQHGRHRLGLEAGLAPRLQLRVVLGGEPEHDPHDRNRRGPDIGNRLPAVGDHDEGGEELGDGGADVACAEDAERRALLLGGVPARHVGDADRERPAGDADAERGQQERRVVVGEGEEPGGDRRRQHDGRVDDAAAVLVGPDAEHQADQRAGEDRRADQQAELGVVEAQVVLDLHANDGKDRPHGEADGEGDRGKPEGAALIASAHVCGAMHGGHPILGSPANRSASAYREPGDAPIDVGQPKEGGEHPDPPPDNPPHPGFDPDQAARAGCRQDVS